MSYIPGGTWANHESTPKVEKDLTFQEFVKREMKKLKMTQKDLAASANLSEPMVSRILTNKNKNGDAFRLTEEIVVAIALALHVGEEGWAEMRHLAFPEQAYWSKALRAHKGVTALNSELSDNNLPTLGLPLLKD